MNVTINGRPIGYSLHEPLQGPLLYGVIGAENDAVVSKDGSLVGMCREVSRWAEKPNLAGGRRIMRQYDVFVGDKTYSGRSEGPGASIVCRPLLHPAHSKYRGNGSGV